MVRQHPSGVVFLYENILGVGDFVCPETLKSFKGNEHDSPKMQNNDIPKKNYSTKSTTVYYLVVFWE